MNIDMMMTAFWTIFQRFLTTFWRFQTILQKLSKDHMNAAEHFPKTSEDYHRFSKIAEVFQGRPEDVLIIHQQI